MAAQAETIAAPVPAGSAILDAGASTVTVAGRQLPLAHVLTYDTRQWDLRAIVRDFFGTDDLETLHADPAWNPHDVGLALPSHVVTRNSWNAGKALRDAVIERSAPLLHAMTHELLGPMAGPIRSIQKLAMMRVNFHGSRAILRFHCDREYGQLPNTINIWLPVTKVHGSNSMYVEAFPGTGAFEPVELDYGQALMFYGTEMLHGTLDNMSGATRISYDFRFSI